MNFFPDGYRVPDAESGYMKFEQGENAFRILSRPIIGNEYWTTDEDGNKKPVRKKMGEKIPIGEIDDSLKHFWAMVVWNYKIQRIQILEITQKGIQRSIKAYADNPKWGSPLSYDLVVTRDGEDMQTKYQVISEPHSELNEDQKISWESVGKKISLNALFDGNDPFEDIETITVEEVTENVQKD
jgi:hypothetical protein